MKITGVYCELNEAIIMFANKNGIDLGEPGESISKRLRQGSFVTIFENCDYDLSRGGSPCILFWNEDYEKLDNRERVSTIEFISILKQWASILK